MKPPLTLLKMTPVTFSFFSNMLLEAGPALLAARLVARQHRFTERVLDALQVDLDLSPTLRSAGLPATANSLSAHAAFHLEADVDDGQVLLDADDLALDDAAFEQVLLGKAFGQQRGEIVARGVKVLGRAAAA